MLSFLGTGTYEMCKYEFNGTTSNWTKYIQKAILDVMNQQNKIVDEVVIFLTPEAKEKNWIATSPEDLKLFDELKNFIEEAKLSTKVDYVDINVDQSEENIWNLFEIMIENMNEGDKIIFDITHSFRYQPMLAMLAIHYARIVKKIEIEAVYYGGYVPFSGKEIFPILDLTSFAELQDWITNVYTFSETGRADILTHWLAEKQSSIRRIEKAAAADLKPIGQLTNLWNEHAYVMQTNRSLDRVKSSKNVLNKISELEGTIIRPVFKPLVHLFDNLKESIEPLAEENRIDNDIHAVEWCIENGLYQQAITIACELPITVTCLLGEKEIVQTARKEANTILKSALKIYEKNNDINPEKIHTSPKYSGFVKAVEKFTEWDKELALGVLKKIISKKEFLRSLHLINEYRNDINHAGFRSNPIPGERIVRNFIREFAIFKYEIKKLLNDYSV